MKTKGIILISFGKRGYGFAAVNLAASLKFYSPEIPITLYTDENCIKQITLDRLGVLDDIQFLKEEDYKTNGKIDPAKIKTDIYKFCKYDYNLYLDVDAVCLKDITPLFDELINKGGYYYSHIVGLHTIDKGRDFKDMQWAYADDIWEQYNLDKDAVLPATNSSFQFIKKCKEAEELYKQVKENYANPIPLEKLRLKWGGSQPDELYLNIALAQKGITGKTEKEYIFFGHNTKLAVKDLVDNYYVLSVYGGVRFTMLRFREFYDKLLHKILPQMKMMHHYKLITILQDKHVNGK